MLEGVLNWIVLQIEFWSYPGIFLMMFLESTFFPFPSEVAMIPAGVLAYKGTMNATLAVLAAVLGSLAGAFFNYYLARRVGIPVLRRYGRYIFFNESRLERCNVVFRIHGEIATFVCRLIPVVRQYISLPAGIAGMNLLRFGIYTGLGAAIWVTVLTWFGYIIGPTVIEVLESDKDEVWQVIRGAWQDHRGPVLMWTGVSLTLVIGAYVLWYRRKTARVAKREAAPSNPEPESEPVESVD